jgi:hypothetical protein
VAPAYSDVRVEEAKRYFRTTLYPAALALSERLLPRPGRRELSDLPWMSFATT